MFDVSSWSIDLPGNPLVSDSGFGPQLLMSTSLEDLSEDGGGVWIAGLVRLTRIRK